MKPDLIFSVALLIFAVLLIASSAYFMARNDWVSRERLKAIDRGYYDRLPSYEAMLYRRWWVWDIERFLE